MVDLDKMRRALVAVAQGRDRETLADDETKQYYDQLHDEVAAMQAKGIDVAIPDEWPDLTEEDLEKIRSQQRARTSSGAPTPEHDAGEPPATN